MLFFFLFFLRILSSSHFHAFGDIFLYLNILFEGACGLRLLVDARASTPPLHVKL